MADIISIIENNWKRIQNSYPNVLNISEGTKIKGGIDTGVKCIRIFVEKKVALSELSIEQRIPEMINDAPVDIIELKPQKWTAGKTNVSAMSPSTQKRLASGVMPVGKNDNVSSGLCVKAIRPNNVEADWRSVAQPIQDQMRCGSCCAFGNIGVWEARHLQVFKEKIKLSEQHLFTCSSGLCNYGNTMERTLNQAIKGVCLEHDMPYSLGSGVDKYCGQDLPADWYLRGKKLESWASIDDINVMLTYILSRPLSSTMTVYQSFFNYKSGVYSHLPTGDSIAGYHCIGILGASDRLSAWLVRNSWSKEWGDDGYCWVAYGDSDIDKTMYDIKPSNDPVGDPGPLPIPSKCPWGNKAASMLNVPLKLLGRDGRFAYVRPKGYK